MDTILDIWQNDHLRQILLGLMAMLLISGAKAISEYLNENKALKYVAVFVLSAIASVYSGVWGDCILTWGEFFNGFIAVVAYSIGSYQTIGKLATALLEQYKPKEE